MHLKMQHQLKQKKSLKQKVKKLEMGIQKKRKRKKLPKKLI